MTARKGWLRLDTALARMDWSDREVLTWVRLVAYMVDRWAREKRSNAEAGQVRISRRDIMSITGRQRFDSARALLEKTIERAVSDLLGDPLTISYCIANDSLSIAINWPKFAEYQGLVDRTRAEDGPLGIGIGIGIGNGLPLPPEEGGAPAPKKRSKRTDPPDALTPDQRSRLEAWALKTEPWAMPHLADLIDACLGHHAAKGNQMKDWHKAVQNWIRNERTKYGAPKRPKAAKKKGAIAAAMAVAQRLEDEGTIH